MVIMYISTHRSENVQLQVKLRELENYRDSYAVVSQKLASCMLTHCGDLNNTHKTCIQYYIFGGLCTFTQLQSACLGLGQTLGCTMEGVAAESVGQILGSRASRLTQEHAQTLHQV